MMDGVTETSENNLISANYRRLAAAFTERVEAVKSDQWDNPSPCEGWVARDVVAHILSSYVRMPAAVDLSLGLTKSVTEDPVGAWIEARDGMQALLDDPSRAQLEYDGMFGRTSLADTVDNFLGIDLLLHAWDLARATGQDETLPAHDVHRFYTQILPSADQMRIPGVFGAAVEVPEAASEQDRLLALAGRQP